MFQAAHLCSEPDLRLAERGYYLHAENREPQKHSHRVALSTP